MQNYLASISVCYRLCQQRPCQQRPYQQRPCSVPASSVPASCVSGSNVSVISNFCMINCYQVLNQTNPINKLWFLCLRFRLTCKIESVLLSYWNFRLEGLNFFFWSYQTNISGGISYQKLILFYPNAECYFKTNAMPKNKLTKIW